MQVENSYTKALKVEAGRHGFIIIEQTSPTTIVVECECGKYVEVLTIEDIKNLAKRS